MRLLSHAPNLTGVQTPMPLQLFFPTFANRYVCRSLKFYAACDQLIPHRIRPRKITPLEDYDATTHGPSAFWTKLQQPCPFFFFSFRVYYLIEATATATPLSSNLCPTRPFSSLTRTYHERRVALAFLEVEPRVPQYDALINKIVLKRSSRISRELTRVCDEPSLFLFASLSWFCCFGRSVEVSYFSHKRLVGASPASLKITQWDTLADAICLGGKHVKTSHLGPKSTRRACCRCSLKRKL